jgi:hypothetical protein
MIPPWKCFVLNRLQAHVAEGRPMSGHCEGVCAPDTIVCALVHGSIREVRRGWQSQKSLIFMHFHEVFLGSQHEIWAKQHNGKVRLLHADYVDTCGQRTTVML